MQASFQLVWSIEGIPEDEIPRHRASTRIVPQRGDHAGKLNALAKLVIADACDADLLVFLDGDALPVGSLDGVLELAGRGRLVAVRRDENEAIRSRIQASVSCRCGSGGRSAATGAWDRGGATGPAPR